MPETKPLPNQKLRHERERCGWSQQDVADKVGTTPLNVGRWERGVTQPGPHFRQKLCEIFEKGAYQLGLLQEKVDEMPPTISLAQETPTSFWNVPYKRNLFFTGREDILRYLYQAFLNGQQPIALTQPQAISGLGGIGKTQTAVEYAYRYRDNYDTVFWARADSADLLSSDFLLISTLLNLPQRNQQDQSVVVKAVLRWFDRNEKWLLILDNADHFETVSEFIPSVGKGHVLLTTRANSTGTMAQHLEIEKMGSGEGMLFLLRRMKRLKGNAGLESVPENIRKQAQAIVEALDGLPLALDQAGAYIEETGCNLSDYLKFYKTRRKHLLRTRGRDATGHPEPVATTWSLSFEKVERANPAAAELLRLCAFLHPDEIPESMIVEGASELGSILQPVVEDELELNEAIGEPLKYSLVKRDPDLKLLNIHRLVQAVIKDAMDEETQRHWTESAVRMVNQAFPLVKFTTRSQCERYLPHAQICAILIQQADMTFSEAASLLNQTGSYLRERARYAEAETLLQHALRMREHLGLEYPDMAQSLYDLALLYDLQANYAEAELLYHRALLIREQYLGSQHAEIAQSLNGLAGAYSNQGKYLEAELLYQRALRIREQQLGPQHADTAESLNDLAGNYYEQGKYIEAEPLYRRALMIREQQLEFQHPDIARSLNDLALLHYNQGKYTEAESLYQRALKIRVEQQGLMHQDTAISLNNMGMLYERWGKYAQAEPLLKQALTIREQLLEPDSPDRALSMNNLASLYYRQGRYAEAEPLIQRALVIREQQLGPEHAYTARSLSQLALVYHRQGRFMEAEPLMQRALAIWEQQLGSEHPWTALGLNHLAQIHTSQKKFEEAEYLFKRSLTIRERLGLDHPDTAEILNNLAMLYYEQEQYAEAELLYQQTLSIHEQMPGIEHPDIATTLENYAALLHKTHREGEAAPLEKRAQEIRAKQE